MSIVCDVKKSNWKNMKTKNSMKMCMRHQQIIKNNFCGYREKQGKPMQITEGKV